MRTLSATAAVGAMLVLGQGLPVQAQDAPPTTKPRVERTADVSSDLLDQLLDDGTEKQQPPSAASRAGDDLQGRVAGPSMFRVGQQMQRVQHLLSRDQTAAPTQQLQQSILRELDRMIAASAENAQKSTQRRSPPDRPQSGRDGNPSSGTRPSGELGSTANATANSVAGTDRWLSQIWGHLPDQARQQIISPLHEEFLPAYERIIKQYYKRLAEVNQGGLPDRN